MLTLQRHLDNEYREFIYYYAHLKGTIQRSQNHNFPLKVSISEYQSLH